MTINHLRPDLTFETHLAGQSLQFRTTWGLFSPKAIDEGTSLLASYLQNVAPTAATLDLGCGYGPLGLTLARLAPAGQHHLVDKDFVAVEYTTRNAALNHLANTHCYLSNGFDQIPPELKFDLIVSNIPAKIGNELLTIWLHDAHDRLKPGGQLAIVTIAGLKDYFKRHLTEVFGNYHKLGQSKTYTAAQATKN